MKHSPGPFPTSCRSQSALPVVRLSRGLRSATQSLMFVGDLRQRRAVVDVKQARYARIAAAGACTSWYRTSLAGGAG